jgi:hypothetical protein
MCGFYGLDCQSDPLNNAGCIEKKLVNLFLDAELTNGLRMNHCYDPADYEPKATASGAKSSRCSVPRSAARPKNAIGHKRIVRRLGRRLNAAVAFSRQASLGPNVS